MSSSGPGPRDYTQGTERALYTFSAATCYFTDCRTPVIVFVEGEPVSNVEIAHIHGAVQGSPRYDATMNDDERRSFANLILLCTPHHKIVDRLHPDNYPAEVLADWKVQHERDSGADGSALSPITEDRLLDLIEKAIASIEGQNERQLVFSLFNFLDGRRVLFDPWTIEEPQYVAASILEIRRRIDGDLGRLKPKAKAVESLRAIRAACLRYLSRVPHPQDAPAHWPGAINDLRAGVADGIESLERDYDLEMPGGTGRDTTPIQIIYIPIPEGKDPV
jgi:hypothetical protein